MSAERRPAAYFDSSVLVKNYLPEKGVAAARRLFGQYRILSASLAPLEITSALRRHHFDGRIAAADFTNTLQSLRADTEHWDLCNIDEQMLMRAEHLLRSANVRTLDAIHISAALSYQAAFAADLPFVTADLRQRVAAGAAGLSVVWVE